MKKYFVVLAIIGFVGTVFGYIGDDVGYASLLAQSKVINKQENPDKYRLDDKILRQEVIGMALKMADISLPDDYRCKGYFSDAKQNDWVCRAVEIAADNGIITRKNTKARPKDMITPEEATAMFMSVKKISYPKNIKVDADIVAYSQMSQWMIDLHQGSGPLGIHIPSDNTRKNIFKTAYQIQSYVSGLRFESCFENPESKPYLHINSKRIDLGELLKAGETACLGLGYGGILYKTGEILSVKLSGEIASNRVVSINTRTGVVIPGGIEWTSQDGVWGISIMEDQGNPEKLNTEVSLWIINMGDSTREGNLLIHDSYILPISLGMSYSSVELSPDYNMVAIYTEGFDQSKIYVFNRKLNKIIKEVDFGNSVVGQLHSVDNSGKYTFKSSQ